MGASSRAFRYGRFAMKILALHDYQVSFQADGLICGLHESGNEIWEMPIVNHIHGGTDADYDLPDGKPGLTHAPDVLSNALPMPVNKTAEEALDHIPEFDLICLLSLRDHSLRALESIRDRIGEDKFMRLPLVVCDGEDHEFMNGALLKSLGAKIFFKREFLKHIPVGGMLWPLPFSAFYRSYPIDCGSWPKEYDIFLSLGMTHPDRDIMTSALLEYAIDNEKEHWIGVDHNSTLHKDHPYKAFLKERLDWPTYIKKQAHSRVTGVVRGFGRDTLHSWEAFSFETVVLYNDPGIIIPHPPKNGKHCIYVDLTKESIKEALDDIFNYEMNWVTMSREGAKWCKQYHSNKARAEYMVNIAHETIYGDGKKDHTNPDRYLFHG